MVNVNESSPDFSVGFREVKIAHSTARAENLNAKLSGSRIAFKSVHLDQRATALDQSRFVLRRK